MRMFGSDRIAKVMDFAGYKEGEVIQHSMITKSIERAQRKVEENNFGIRKRLLEYDDVMTQHRKVIYSYRYDILQGEELVYDLVCDMIAAAVEDIFARLVPDRTVTAEQEDEIITFLSRVTFLDKIKSIPKSNDVPFLLQRIQEGRVKASLVIRT